MKTLRGCIPRTPGQCFNSQRKRKCLDQCSGKSALPCKDYASTLQVCTAARCCYSTPAPHQLAFSSSRVISLMHNMCAQVRIMCRMSLHVIELVPDLYSSPWLAGFLPVLLLQFPAHFLGVVLLPLSTHLQRDLLHRHHAQLA